MKNKRVFGAYEWACKTVNICNGCRNDCLYCYAKCNAIRFKRKTRETWANEEISSDKIAQAGRGSPTRIMFPSAHDIHPGNLDYCLRAIRQMLDHGHTILIVTKPRFSCIRTICDELAGQKDRITLRFTITAAYDYFRELWEPKAASVSERMAALEFAFTSQFKTSISCEPMLHLSVGDLVPMVRPYVTDSIWLGLMNNISSRLRMNGAPEHMIRTAESVRNDLVQFVLPELVEKYRNDPIIRWKDSVREALDMAAEEKTGER